MPETPEREQEGRGPVTWRELGRDILKPGRGQLVIALILALVGFALTLLLRQPEETRYSTLRQSELVSMLDDVTAETRRLGKLSEGSSEILDLIRSGFVSYVINTRAVSSGTHSQDGASIRRCAIENGVTIFTSLDTARIVTEVLEEMTISVSTIDAE